MAVFVGGAAHAQRTGDNATRQAGDAFGTRVGDEQIGIYNSNDVRGFSAVEAGNTRIEGLYFQQQAEPNERLVASSTMRVGISAQGYAFPAPTGIVDYGLRLPGARSLASLVLRYGPYGSKAGQLDLSLALDGERLGLQAGAGYSADRQPYGGTGRVLSLALAGVWKPAPGIRIIPFWSRTATRGQETQLLAFTAGDYLPPRVERGVFIGQKWATNEADEWNSGLIAQASVRGIDVAAGVFRSVSRQEQSATPLLLGIRPDRTASERLVILDRGDRFAATSGELRLSRRFEEGKRRHTLVATARGRDQQRLYGGSDVITLQPALWGEPAYEPMPPVAFGPKTRDHVRQVTLGAGYQLEWPGRGELALGVQKTHYVKSIATPQGSLPESRSDPVLVNASAAVDLLRGLAVYGSYTRGLEESPVAPDQAVNRNEAPPAFRTQQEDVGVRWKVTPGFTVIAGAFEIRKPYYNLDTQNRFRQLGQLRDRGIELSAAGEVTRGLNVVLGTALIDAQVSGELVDKGLIGRKPTSALGRHSIASLDYRFRNSPLSIDASVEETGRRVANAQNTLTVPPRAVVGLGGRYRFSAGHVKGLIRAQVSNIFNVYGYAVGGSGFFIYNNPRRASITLTLDS